MYTQTITRQNRGAILIAIDCSLSMSERINFNNLNISKAEAVALICNYILDELLALATRGREVRNYYDIAVLGYHDDVVESMLPTPNDGFVAIDTLATYCPPPKNISFDQFHYNRPVGGATFTLHPWITPQISGTTPMYKALLRIEELVEEWCQRPENQNSFPPIVLNITDGEYSDGTTEDMLTVADNIKSLSTAGGKTLLLNIQLSTHDSKGGFAFPEEHGFYSICPYRRMLFHMSSTLPQNMEPLVKELINPLSYGPYRCVAFNASINELFMILNIGSQSVRER